MEPIKTNKDGTPGRPEYSDEQYAAWLEELRPHLEQLGCSLYRACVRAGLLVHETAIRRKYDSKDWFCRKIDTYRAGFGDNINEALARLTNKIMDRVKAGEPVTTDEVGILKHMSQYHRTAQPFFANRQENAIPKPEEVGKILDELEAENIDDVGPKAHEQVVAAEQSLQNKG